ncbi:MAG: DUF2089 domain-containing protein [Roseiflexaceae bacterium]|nr:DUF2089 domain-containing protein [Roseiflexaceae bacterium]
MNQLISTCPICDGALHVERLGCEQCDTHLEGHFSLGWIGRLNRDQLGFVELLVKNRGNINGVAADLRVAYNTARSRLDDVVAALGYAAPADTRVERRVVLDKLAAKEISVEDAMKLLKQ